MSTESFVKKSPLVDVNGLYWESRVSEALGVPRKTIANLRGQHLTLGEDFVRRENNAVALTRIGLAKLESLLATEAPVEGGFPAGKPAANGTDEVPADIPAGPPETAVMTVFRVPPQQAKLLLCTVADRKEIVTVKVRENVMFRAGMSIEAMKGRDGYWQFRNREGGDVSMIGRLPRNPGRW